MKILLLNQTFHPDSLATSQQLTDLALYLTGLGHRVSVVCDRSDYESRSANYPARENYRGIDIHRVKATGFGKLSFIRRIADGVSFHLAAFIKLLRLPRQDVVVSFTSPPLIGFPGAIYCRLTGARSVQWLMDVNPDAAIAVGYLRPAALPTRVLVKVFEYTLRSSSVIVVLDRWMKERAVGRGAAPEKIAIIPPWSAHTGNRESGTADGRRFREKHGLTGKHLVMYSGNHSVVHPLDTVLDAAAALKGDPDIRFVFVGGGLRVRDVTARMQRDGLQNILQLQRQPREELPDLLAAADLHLVVMGEAVNGLVHTSKIYGVLESGTPFVFVGPRASHIGDLLKECPCGHQVEHGDVQGLVEAIRNSTRFTSEQRSAHGKRVGAFVRGRYTPAISLEAFSREVLGRFETAERPAGPARRLKAV